VPRANVREQDLMRDEVARNLASQASALNQALSDFKKKALGDMADLIKTGERYEVTLAARRAMCPSAAS
jgi:hypothetical protein